MNNPDFWARWMIREVQGQVERNRRARRAITGSIEEDIEELRAQNDQLQLMVSALLEVLYQKQIVSPLETQEMLQRLIPAPPEVEDSPFANLDE